MVSEVSIEKFRKAIWKHYRLHARSFPWRKTRDPYKIFVSEVMLQQTQADRVAPFFKKFINRFPDFKTLAKAPVSDVIRLWQGLGYNRRALYLKRSAEKICREYGGELPKDAALLEALPGIGAYTASAVLTFAWNVPTVFIETNIRSVYIYFFFKNRDSVSDAEIFKIIERTLEKKRAREWYTALMDFGAMLKRTVGNVNVKSRHFYTQPRFEGSRRQIRGRLLSLASTMALSESSLVSFADTQGCSLRYTQDVLRDLVSEGFLCKKGHSFVLS